VRALLASEKPAAFSTMKFTLIVLLSSLAIGQILAADKADPMTDEGVAAYKAGNYDVAIERYSAVLKKNPKNAIVYNDRALAYKEKKDYARAIADFTEALRLKPDWFVYYNRGIAYQEKGDDDSAIADFTKALKRVPDAALARIDCLVGRGQSYVNKEETEPAMADLNAAIKLGAEEPDPYVLRGILHKVQHDYSRSMADYEKAIALGPKNARSYGAEAYLLSVCPAPKYRNGRKAVAYATKACELTDWKSSLYLEDLAAAYAENRQFDEAINWQKKAAQIDPKGVDPARLALYQQKKPYRDLNRKEQAIPDTSDLGDKIAIKIGERLSAQFQVRDDQLVDSKIATGLRKKPNSLLLDFQLEKENRTLWLNHTFRRSLQARCLARLKGYDTYFETDILPVPVQTRNPELWSDPIEELVLFDFKLTGPETPLPTPPEEDNQVASLAVRSTD
jgi:tetratricopeptide (TPR) repeat protein